MKHSQNSKLLRSHQSGFTLTEMLVVMALLGIVMSIVGYNVADRFSRGKMESTKIRMRQMMGYLDAYKLDCNQYPTTDQTLEALVEKPAGAPECRNYDPKGYIPGGKLPKDDWGTEFIYESDGKTFEVKSMGANKVEGGDAYDKDISTKDFE